MTEDKSAGSGAQREFDPERDQAAVKKLRDWNNGTVPDPAMEGLPGEKWWRARIKKKQSTQKTDEKAGK
jgi:hypothetical protein